MLRPLVLALIAATPLHAQAGLVGTWKVSYAAGTQISDGERTTIFGGGILAVESKGDSLVATLTPDSMPGMPKRPPVRMTALASEVPAKFVAHTKATINQNGDIHEANATSTWSLAVRGDSLSGTVSRTIEGLPEGTTSGEAVKGVRAR